MATGFEKSMAELGRTVQRMSMPRGKLLVERTLEQAEHEATKANEAVRGILGTNYSVDEIAVYFPEEALLLDFLKHAVSSFEWGLFNWAEDNVRTNPIVGAYAVEYWFLGSEHHPYRLELMTLPPDEGFSPYHASLHSVVGRLRCPTLAHASFKVKNDTEYGNALFHFKQAGYEVLQHCESTYGKFSYLRPDTAELPIKPRINLRDAGVDSGN